MPQPSDTQLQGAVDDSYPTGVPDERNGLEVSLQGILRLGYDGYFETVIRPGALVKAWSVPENQRQCGGRYVAACPQVLFFAFPYQPYMARHGDMGALVSSTTHGNLGFGVNVLQFFPDGKDHSMEGEHFFTLDSAVRWATRRILAYRAIAVLNVLLERGAVKLDPEMHDFRFEV